MNMPDPNFTRSRELLDWLHGAVAETLEVSPGAIDVDAEFDELGLDSVQAVALSGAVSDKVGYELPATLLYEHRNIRELAQYLAMAGEQKP